MTLLLFHNAVGATLSANAQRVTMTLLQTLIKQSVERLTETIIITLLAVKFAV